MAILQWGARHGCLVHGHWMRRSTGPIELCDYMSKALAEHDFRLHRAVVAAIDSWSGPHTIDAMASSAVDAQCPRFWTRFAAPRSQGVDAFARSWTGEHVWVYPPLGAIGRAFCHARDSRCSGTFLVPADTSAPWWPMLAPFAPGVAGHWRFARQQLRLTRNGSPYRPATAFIAVAFDFTAISD